MKRSKRKIDRNRESDKGETAVSANLPRSVILGPARLPQGTAAPWSEMFGMLFQNILCNLLKSLEPDLQQILKNVQTKNMLQ